MENAARCPQALGQRIASPVRPIAPNAGGTLLVSGPGDILVSTDTGRSALRAWRRSRRILEGTPRKLAAVDELFRPNQGRRILVFTNDNATAFEVSRRFLVPALTHHTDASERKRWLAAFSDGSQPILVTSRVLNEGVDVPEAEVAIVMSGSGTLREHVQRLGRILRRHGGKQAVLYELVVADSAEESTSARRREHDAYRR